MARPSNAIIWSYTPNGTPFQWLLDGYRARGAKDASTEVIQVLVSWEDSEDFLEEAVGFTLWDGESSYLERQLPLACPTKQGLWCDDYEFVKMGAYDNRTDFNDPLNGNFWVQDWVIYSLTFTRPRYWVRSDYTLFLAWAGLEKNRYVSRSRRYVPRERKTPGYIFETIEAVPQPVSEVGFLPDYQLEHVVTWHQVPFNAIPEKAIAELLLKVNSTDWQIESDDYVYTGGTLLFKGPQQPYERYLGADGNFYVDLSYVFTYQPHGWNKGRKNDGSYVKLRVRGSAAGLDDGIPPYSSGDFDRLFRPYPSAGP